MGHYSKKHLLNCEFDEKMWAKKDRKKKIDPITICAAVVSNGCFQPKYINQLIKHSTSLLIISI